MSRVGGVETENKKTELNHQASLEATKYYFRIPLRSFPLLQISEVGAATEDRVYGHIF